MYINLILVQFHMITPKYELENQAFISLRTGTDSVCIVGLDFQYS